MKCELRVISGARQGHRDVFDKSYIGVGRHPLSDLRFDAEKDLDASTRHAAIVKTGDAYVLKDLGSTNGTFVNGEKLARERALRDGDTLRFGVHGPEVSFHVLRDAQEAMIDAVHAPAAKEDAPPRRRAEAPPAPPAPPPSKTSVLRAEISAQRGRYRSLAVALVLIVVGALAVVYWQGKKSGDVITVAQHTVDSLNAELGALRQLQAQNDSEKTALQAALRTERDPARAAQIQTRLTTVTARSAAIQTAQGVDYTAIRAANDPAIAMITVRFPDSTIDQGTAFSVSTTGQLITNRHVVISEHGAQAMEIAIQFSGSREVLPARVVRVSADADLALVQLESQGPFPAIAGFAPAPLVVGDPIALIGFPGGGGEAQTPRAKLVTGSVSRVVPDSLYELDAFSGVGASGSPIFDRDGKAIGVEFGGLQGTSGTAIVGLPIARVQALLGR